MGKINRLSPDLNDDESFLNVRMGVSGLIDLDRVYIIFCSEFPMGSGFTG
jgi:hypothetical protein